MMVELLISGMVVFSVVMNMVNNVLGMGFVVINVALLTTFVSMLTTGYWFGLVMFLIYVSGLLMLFGYMMVMNPVTSVSFWGVKSWFVWFVPIFVGLLIGDNVFGVHKSNVIGEKIIWLFNSSNLFVYLFIVSLLFVVLVLAVYMCLKSPRPLRSYLVFRWQR